jgi:hypothetical protein
LKPLKRELLSATGFLGRSEFRALETRFLFLSSLGKYSVSKLNAIFSIAGLLLPGSLNGKQLKGSEE